MRRLATLVLVLAVLLGAGAVVVDRWMVSRVEEDLLARAGEHMELAPQSEVTVDGFPFLTQVLAGRLAEVRGTAPSLTVEGFTLEDVRVAGRGIAPSEPYPAENLEINAEVPIGTLRTAVAGAVDVPGADLGLDIIDGRVRLSLLVAGVELVVGLEPTVVEDEVALRLGEVLLGESEAPGWLVDGLDDLLSDVRLEIPGLPDGLRPTRLAVTDDALQVRLEGTDVELLTLLE